MVNDFLGNEIKKGAWVVYPTRRGSVMKLKKALVFEVLKSKNKTEILVQTQSGKMVKLTLPDRCVIVKG
jgi:hypothetical protein